MSVRVLICSLILICTVAILIRPDSTTSTGPLPESTVHAKSGTGTPWAVQLRDTLLRYSASVLTGSTVITAWTVREWREYRAHFNLLRLRLEVDKCHMVGGGGGSKV